MQARVDELRESVEKSYVLDEAQLNKLVRKYINDFMVKQNWLF